MTEPNTVTLRIYLVFNVCQNANANWMTAWEAVHSTAIEHPEWDLDERRTWEEWDQWARGTV